MDDFVFHTADKKIRHAGVSSSPNHNGSRVFLLCSVSDSPCSKGSSSFFVLSLSISLCGGWLINLFCKYFPVVFGDNIFAHSMASANGF
jgi:hypothetical protein